MKIVKPESVDLNGERLKDLDKMFFDNYIGLNKLSCTQTLIARRGEIAHFHSQGKRDIENDLPVDEETLFRIYSMTKPVTGVALMQLFEKGYFQLSDPVSKFLPEFKNQEIYVSGSFPNFITEPVRSPMIIRDLLTHTSGLSYSINFQSHVDDAYRKIFQISDPTKALVSDEKVDLEEFTKRIASLPLEFNPGDQWLYSVSIDICARLIEVISGKSIEDYFQENIFDPLGMEDTGFFVKEENLKNLAACYFRDENKKLHVHDPGAKESRYAKPREFNGGGSGLISTSFDYFKFLQMLLNGGTYNGNRILSRKTIELMTMNHLPNNKNMSDMGSTGSFSEVRYQGTGYGLSMAVTTDPAASQSPLSIGSFNWGGMASTYFWVDPKEELLAIFMTQFIPSDAFPLRPQMQTMVYGSFLD
ncbi:MAG: serine hydrolase domain-containing protein [Pseudomonadota bacterium]|nr:beta-lactamase family protein [SAR86 cluster bacterium]MEC7269077.1 serine hydrolase domain-containing protein [Pseudomonadota bacterium]MEC7465687.1 serine hydrolase domain-containing protein [Pseudomonadota bacterium]MEC7787771.1 serine hydrolase domain-containing protein [Pseudomonadota bacterium]MEC8108779.1 serine hydrolase domain-containing protein [Pseudomonadota bacterium]|tara:strand:+ start:711 stop:1961 length:1251 start_codon:yes stop_codon:yes gene_type:complete